MKHYNISALRGGKDTDEQTRLDLLEAKPGLTIPQDSINTPRFVPSILNSMQTLQETELLSQRNPETNEFYTQQEAKETAFNNAKMAYRNYRRLLDVEGK